MAKPIFIIAGVGRGSGTGAASAKLFAKNGYRVALVSRTKEHLDALAAEIVKDGGEAASFPVSSYNYADTLAVFDALRRHDWKGEGSEIRGALYNAGSAPFKTFLDITEQDLAGSLETQVTGAFAFSHGAISAFKENAIDEKGRRGVLIFTVATASVRGNTFTSVFAAGKHAVRALSQSLAKAYGKENIHVAHAIIDGGILTGQRLERFESEEERKKYEANADIRLSGESIAESYLYLANQDRSSWTWELDLRPAHEKW